MPALMNNRTRAVTFVPWDSIEDAEMQSSLGRFSLMHRPPSAIVADFTYFTGKDI